MVRWLKLRAAVKRNHSGNPVPEGMFRMVVLNDNPYMDYIGWRAWCSGHPYWEDGRCRCAHEEKRAI